MNSEKPIRVLHAIGSLEIGGSQAFVMNIYRKIDRSKIQFDFVCDHEDKMFHAREIKQLGGKVYVFSPYKGYNGAAYRHQWNELLAHHPEYRIVHGHARGAAPLYLKSAKDAKRITIMHAHSTSEGTRIKKLSTEINRQRVGELADYKMACSLDAANWYFGDKVVDSHGVLIIKNAIDAKEFVFAEHSGEAERTQGPIIVNVGRLIPQKNQAFAITVFSKFLQLCPDSRLLIVGDGPLREDLVSLAAGTCPEGSVEFLGSRPDVNNILKCSDIFIMTSINEGLGIALVEAQAAGLPCLVSDAVPAEADIISDRVVRLGLTEPEETWAQALLRLSKIEKRNTFNEIVRAGYDSAANVRFFEEFYSSLYSSNA